MLLKPEDSAECGWWQRTRPGFAIIFVLATASTGALLICPCDLPGRNPRAFPLIGASIAFGLAAAAFVYRMLQRYTGITVLLRAFYAAAIVAFAVYLEFDFVTYIIAWLARPH